MAGTLTMLVKHADFNSTPGGAGGVGGDDQQAQDDRQRDRLRGGKTRIGDLVYSVNIVLPESRDPAVYDALFKALREHLD